MWQVGVLLSCNGSPLRDSQAMVQKEAQELTGNSGIFRDKDVVSSFVSYSDEDSGCRIAWRSRGVIKGNPRDSLTTGEWLNKSTCHRHSPTMSVL